MSRPHLTFWFEFASTYSYLTAMRIEEAADKAGVDVTWRPFLLGPIFRDQGYQSSPFNELPRKGAYMWADMARRAARLGLPFQRPDPFPQNSLLATRVATAALSHDTARGEAFCRALYTAEFGHGRQLDDPETLSTCLGTADLPPDLMEKAVQADTKARLRSMTEAAEAAGIFGAPSFTTSDGTLFWGDDRLEDALDWAREHADG